MNRRRLVRLGSILLLGAGLPTILSAVTVRGGLALGWRGINDARITSTYHPGLVYSPFLEVGLGKTLTLGLAVEDAKTMTGKLGDDESSAAFRLSSLQVYAGAGFLFGDLALGVRVGWAYFHYTQTVDNAFVSGIKVDDRASAVQIGVGGKYFLQKFLFLSVQAEYVPLKVKPYDEEVDLGGWRILGGLGFAVDF